MDGAVLRARLGLLLGRPVSRLRAARRCEGRRGHFFRRLDPFTAGGALQTVIAFPGRHSGGTGRAAWRAAVIQSAGTLFFNVTTYQALQTSITNSNYDRLVWRPDAFGSICFLVSARSRTTPRPGTAGYLPGAAQAGGNQRSTCSAASFSASPPGRATSSPRPARAQPSGGQLQHRPRSRLLPHLRAGHTADRPYPQVATAAAPAPTGG